LLVLVLSLFAGASRCHSKTMEKTSVKVRLGAFFFS